MTTITEFQANARRVFGAVETQTSHADPISFLYSMSWDVPNGAAFPEDMLATMNVNFDERGCFGRAVKGAVLVEQLFPNHTLYAGEVCDDLLRTWLLADATQEKWNDETFIAELLQYENPHIVLVDESGNQFDPLFKELTLMPKKLRHSQVLQHTLWEGLHCAYLVSEAIVHRNTHVDAYLSILERAHTLYPNVVLVKENLASAYCLVGQYEKAIILAKEVAKVRKDAKTLLFLWLLTNDVTYKHSIIEQYDEKVFDFLTKNIPA